jgi:hypothetical protein
MLANVPPLAFFQLQTFGGVYSVMRGIPWVWRGGNDLRKRRETDGGKVGET